MRALIRYFAGRSFVANVVMFGLMIAAVAAWDFIGKEERPEFSMNWVRVNIPYPGASAEDVELFVIKPVEEQFKGISGLREVSSTAAFSRASFRITTDPDIQNFQEKYQEIKDAVERADLPTEVEDAVYDRFNSAEKAIVDVALYLEGIELLSVKDRRLLQEYALTFKNQLLSLPEVSGIEASGYLKPEIQIEVDPKKLIDYELPMAEVANQIERQHIRTPLGVMEDKNESEVALRSYLDEIEPLRTSVIRSSFQNRKVLLSDLAEVHHGFERTTSIRKIQGHEAVVFNVQKSRGVGILKAREAVIKFKDKFVKNHADSPIRIALLDDESYDVRNRLSLIATNGLLGFLIILLVLFMFLDFRSGFWVAMGLPFSLAFTMIACVFVGYTINNITLAAIIIVLGIVVDDAIIVADSISKFKSRGIKGIQAATDGTFRVIQPVLAGVLTTCVAFVPLLFFEGRFGMFIKFIPLVVFLMLVASLIESFFILPAHMVDRSTSLNEGRGWVARVTKLRNLLVPKLESAYEVLLEKALHHRLITLGIFGLFLCVSGWAYYSQLKFVMFPREESKEFAVKVIGPEGATRLEMAKLISKIENLLLEDKFKSLVGFRTVIGQSRRGGEVRENEANLRVELLPPSEQPYPFEEMISYWEAEAAKMSEFQEVSFLKSWWSADSGSPIAIEVLENNDEKRMLVSEMLKSELEKLASLKNVEIERPRVKTEYTLNLDRAEAMRLNIDPSQLARTMRAYIEGRILYRLYTDEEIDVRLMSKEKAKREISQVLSLRASNDEGYLVPIKHLVSVSPQEKPSNIQRVNFKRANNVYADMAEKPGMTPLDVATYLEENVFPKLSKESPTTVFNFRGEIEDSRESGSDFALSVVMTLALIYIILTFMFGSLLMPLIIGASIPFGVAGVALAFLVHGMTQYGFFAVIGTIGMLGVVINDSIVMVDHFEAELKNRYEKFELLRKIKEIAITRLRPVILTTLTTVAGVFPTAYGLGGYDAMLADMMLSMGWGLIFGTLITLFLMPIIYSFLATSRREAKEVQ